MGKERKHTEIALSKYKFPLKYDPNGTYIWDAKERMFADVRGWGYLQEFDEPEKLQDAIGEFIVTACNNHYRLLEALKKAHETILNCYSTLNIIDPLNENNLIQLRTEMKNILEAIKNCEDK